MIHAVHVFDSAKFCVRNGHLRSVPLGIRRLRATFLHHSRVRISSNPGTTPPKRVLLGRIFYDLFTTERRPVRRLRHCKCTDEKVVN